MRVASKIALGSGVLTAILLAVLVYNLAQVRRLAALQRDVADIELEAATISLELKELLLRIDSLTRRFIVLRDVEYVDTITQIRADYEKQLDRLTALPLTGAVREHSEALRRHWEEFPLEAVTRHALRAETDDAELELVEDAVKGYSQRTRELTEAVTAASRDAVAAQAARAVAASRRAETLSWMLVAVALTISLPVLWLTVRSIREPLRRLQEGTRSVAGGEFSYQLDASGSDELAALAASFNEMVERLGELDQLKRDFLSHVSHELKTPLVAMEETNRLLLEGLPGPLTGKQRHLLDLNLQSSRRLAAMISKLLDVARMEQRGLRFELRPWDLEPVAREVRDGFAAQARELGVTLEVEAPDGPVIARCDRDRVVQLLGNLVENALKFSPAPGEVLIRVLTADGGGESAARLEVRDHGPGIPDDQKERVFEKFHQLGEDRRGGVGLGLAICSQIAHAHGGDIRVTDNGESGSVFTVTLPLAAAGGRRPMEAASL